MQFFLNDQHDHWPVKRAGAFDIGIYNFGMKDNFEQGGIVPLSLARIVLTGKTMTVGDYHCWIQGEAFRAMAP